MQNEAGEFVDLYLPRRCCVTNRLIGARDHASIQIRFVDIDPSTGRMTNGVKTYDICGSIRAMGEVDDCINRLAVKDGLLPHKFRAECRKQTRPFAEHVIFHHELLNIGGIHSMVVICPRTWSVHPKHFV